MYLVGRIRFLWHSRDLFEGFFLIKKYSKNQDCILLCYSFFQILNKIKLATLKQNFVFHGFDSKESRSQNARSILWLVQETLELWSKPFYTENVA
ncbi:hypothetical protein EDC17_10605 [Sphingobacterium alimentarium]|uniref:Uncharacterized protein n=1 Tax=Sphingobacterium alimentarium TaxID=797292 RepID=A0A4V6P2Y2_9SPHI|nr:hypothetical protein EDC17_10605 [Sphingobacterium alimentarium]